MTELELECAEIPIKDDVVSENWAKN